MNRYGTVGKAKKPSIVKDASNLRSAAKTLDEARCYKYRTYLKLCTYNYLTHTVCIQYKPYHIWDLTNMVFVVLSLSQCWSDVVFVCTLLVEQSVQ